MNIDVQQTFLREGRMRADAIEAQGTGIGEWSRDAFETSRKVGRYEKDRGLGYGMEWYF